MNDVKIKSVHIKPIQSEKFNEDRFLINIVYIINDTDIHKLSKQVLEKPYILNDDPLEIRIYETLSFQDLDKKGKKGIW
ncbi:MAG: hypothetical protein PHN88_02700 [Ignavibacteria bacterium]|nr:hypothetical protein [Ignavibacteria bacterium]